MHCTVPNTEGSRFARFTASSCGRIARVALGAAVIVTGLAFLAAPVGYIVAAAGLLPIASGALNLCPVAPAWGGHFIGARYCDPTRGRTRR
jgi:hypothetical protein